MTVLRFNTVNGKHCCNLEIPYSSEVKVESFNTVNGKYCCNQSSFLRKWKVSTSFNTVNGKYCCNLKKIEKLDIQWSVLFQYRKR